MLIIRSSRVLYRWSLLVVSGASVFKLSIFCGTESYVSGLRAVGFHILTTMHGQNHIKVEKIFNVSLKKENIGEKSILYSMEYVYHNKLRYIGEVPFRNLILKKNGLYESYSLYTDLSTAIY
jgi:hypothetical protein